MRRPVDWELDPVITLTYKQKQEILDYVSRLNEGDNIRYKGAWYEVVCTYKKFKYFSNMVLCHETSGYKVISDQDIYNISLPGFSIY